MNNKLIAQRQSQSCPLSRLFGSEEVLEDFVFHGIRNSLAVILYDNLNFTRLNESSGGPVRLGHPGGR